MNDNKIIESISSSEIGPKFASLWMGDTSGYDSASEADYAITCMVAEHVGPDREKIARIVGQSAVGKREGWSDASYQDITLRKAIQEVCRPTELTPDLEERLTKMAMEMANAMETRDIPKWREPYVLASHLQWAWSGKRSKLSKVVQAYCDQRQIRDPGFFPEFCKAWEKVRLPGGMHMLDISLIRAINEPYPLEDSYGELSEKVASLAYHLSLILNPDPIFLPRVKLAQLLETRPNNISTVVTLLVQDGVLTELNEGKYRYAKGKEKSKAKEYHFNGELLS